jgi:Protein of unknown function (DUF1320)
VLEDRIDTAQQQVDGRLAMAGYTVPFPGSAPKLVRDLVGAIGHYLADLTYRKGKAPASELDPILQRYRWALSQLDAVAGDTRGNRTALIPGVPAPESQVETGSGAVVVAAYGPPASGFLYPGTQPPSEHADGWW